jgi:hypothetical protein
LLCGVRQSMGLVQSLMQHNMRINQLLLGSFGRRR